MSHVSVVFIQASSDNLNATNTVKISEILIYMVHIQYSPWGQYSENSKEPSVKYSLLSVMSACISLPDWCTDYV